MWVVDNASTDGSMEYLQPKFPWVKFEANTQNTGFAKANNQVLQRCTGKYILYLNPDTIVPEDCFEQCISFMESHSNAGALGIRMVDGCGTFLPESKRAFPSPLTAFFKLSGLSALFPKSKLFARYALGYLDEHQNHAVDVLAGAFMLLRADIAQQLNGFDETFFMYGEDIDLSYRVKQAGFANYYFSDSSIIHFKGESTKKGSLNYVRMFYSAMSIFVRKHYSSGKANFFAVFIQIAIWVRAALAALGGMLNRLGFPLIDAALIMAAFYGVKSFWVNYTESGKYFVESMVNVTLISFALFFLATATLAGIYDKKYHPVKAMYAAGVATIVMLAIYSLLPESIRFSRGVILFGGIAALLLITGLRWLMLQVGLVKPSEEEQLKEPVLVVGTTAEFNAVMQVFSNAAQQKSIVGRISADDDTTALGSLADINFLVRQLGVKEIIFCSGQLTNKTIIDTLPKIKGQIRYRFHAAGSNSIVGSDSKDSSGDILSTAEQYNLSDPYHLRMKRMADVSIAIFILLTFPIQIVVAGLGIIQNAWWVAIGKKTWVSYATAKPGLPKLKVGVITTSGLNKHSAQQLPAHTLATTDEWYAKTYTVVKDVKIMLNNYLQLGNRH